MKLNMYEKVYAYTISWAEEAIERYPFTTALITAIIIDRLIW